jgi:hypothetical protein
VAAGNEDTAAFLSAFDEKGAMASLRSELPADVAEALPFLLGASAAGSPVSPTFGELITILAATAAVDSAPASSWKLERDLSPPEGFPESVPEYAELLERFEAVGFDSQNR